MASIKQLIRAIENDYPTMKVRSGMVHGGLRYHVNMHICIRVKSDDNDTPTYPHEIRPWEVVDPMAPEFDSNDIPPPAFTHTTVINDVDNLLISADRNSREALEQRIDVLEDRLPEQPLKFGNTLLAFDYIMAMRAAGGYIVYTKDSPRDSAYVWGLGFDAIVRPLLVNENMEEKYDIVRKRCRTLILQEAKKILKRMK